MTNLINDIESLNSKSFEDYKTLAFNIREAINNYASINLQKKDENLELYIINAKALNNVIDFFNDKLYNFYSNFFYNEELIRKVILQNPQILEEVKINEFNFFFPLIDQGTGSIGRIKPGVDPLIKYSVVNKYFNDNYKSGYYLKSKKEKEGCFIATYAYESYNHQNVITLRKIRDEILYKYPSGRYFIRNYYRYSPTLVTIFKAINFPKAPIKKILHFLIYCFLYKESKD